MTSLREIGGRRLPFLRWSTLRMLLGMRRLTREWQVGDGREEAFGRYIEEHARPGDLDDAIRVADRFCYERSIMMNIGDEKGAILDAGIQRARPQRLLELGAYCGYSGLRTARAMPEGARLTSVEFLPANAAIAERVWAHAGVADRIDVVVGTLGDGGVTLDALAFEPGSVDFVFIDHDKAAYLADLERIVERGWLHPGSIVVADNIRFPGVPDYRAYMSERQGREWRTVEHETHLEYQSLLRDLVLESEYLGPTI